MALSNRSMSGTPSFKASKQRRSSSGSLVSNRIRQTMNNSPGPSNSPNPYAGGHPSSGSFSSPSTSQKNSKSSQSGGPKAPKPPEKPLMPYMRYSRKVWDSVKAQNIEMKLWEIGRLIGQMWRELPDSDKREYNDGYEADRAVWQEKLKVYHNSPAYQQYLREKQRSEQVLAEEERRSKQGKAEQRVSIAPAEYDSEDGGMSVKTIAAARYHRNHTLINQIFNETCVPDPRSVVKEQRLLSLRKQVDMIHVHQTKIEEDMIAVAEKYEAKKRKFAESTEEFNKKLKQICDSKPVVSKERFNEMVETHKNELKEKYNAIKEQQRKEREALDVIHRAQAIAQAEIRANQSVASKAQSQIPQPIHEPITPPSVEHQANFPMSLSIAPSQTAEADSSSAVVDKEVEPMDEDDVMDRSTDQEDEDEDPDALVMSEPDRPDSTIQHPSALIHAQPTQPEAPPTLPITPPIVPEAPSAIPEEAPPAIPEAMPSYSQALPTLPVDMSTSGQVTNEGSVEEPDSTSAAAATRPAADYPQTAEVPFPEASQELINQSPNQPPETTQ